MDGVEDISLNMPTSGVTEYVRNGSDLVLVLAGGETLVLEGYFEGGDKELLFSERGLMTQVEFSDESAEVLSASYQDVDLTGKWSEYDQLSFLDLEYVEPVVAPLVGAGLLNLLGAGAAAAAGVALLDGDSGGGDTSAPNVSITDGVESTEDIVNGEEYDSGTFAISGDGEAGNTIDVTVDDTTATTVVGDDGTWSVVFDSDTIEEGEYSTTVDVTATDGSGNSTTITDILVVDTEAEDLTFDAVAEDDVINISEAEGDVIVSGNSEAGATVVVEMEGQESTVTVAEDGTWSVTFVGGDLPAGSYDSTITATVTDAAGNAASYTNTVHVDLEHDLSIDAVSSGSDGTINGDELSDGVTVSGSGDVGSSVTVTVGGYDRSATVGADGTWSVVFESGTLAEGEYDADISAVSTDAAGNSSTATGTFSVDTLTSVTIDSDHSGGDATINASESQSEMTFSGSAEAGATVVVTLAGVSIETTADSSGSWVVSYAAGSLVGGEYDTTLTAVATDAAGNTATTTTSVTVDTDAGDIALSANPIEGDNVINAVENSDGVWVTGSATPDHQITVNVGGVEHTVTSTSGGSFSAFFAAGEIPSGEYATTATATITDVAGNTETVQVAVDVDTYVNELTAQGAGGADDIVNASEAAAGITISGTVEPYSTLEIAFLGQSYATQGNASGEWSIDIPATSLPSGEGSATMNITATDPAGNTETVSQSVSYDTFVNELSMDSDVGGDGAFNLGELQGGITLTGQVEAGSSVFVTLESVQHQATVAADGSWSVNFAAGEISEGEYDAEVVIEATDAAGNTDSVTTSVTIDTEANASSIATVTRSTTGLPSIAIDETDDAVSVYSYDEDGNATELSYDAFDLGSQTLLNFADEVPNGSQIVVSTEDAAQNVADTLLVVDTTTDRPSDAYFEVDLDNAGLDGFDLSAIDLQFVNGGQVEISADDLSRLTGEENALTILGGSDDRVVLNDATSTGETTTVDGETYDVYSLGDAGSVLVDQEIEIVLP